LRKGLNVRGGWMMIVGLMKFRRDALDGIYVTLVVQ
jgi:hypothetical protein